jgi:hypothetical protein
LNTTSPSLADEPRTSALPLADVDRPRPRGVELLAICLTAIAVRVAIVAAAAALGLPWAQHSPHPTVSKFWHHALWGDGYAYVAQAEAMREPDAPLDEFDRRAFPGFPALIAIANLAGVPINRAVLLIPWLCAGIAAATTAILFRDRRMGWAMSFLTPHYLTYSAMPMTEGILLAFTVGGICVARYRPGWAAIVGGLLIGYAGMIRPMACFAAGGYVCYELVRGRIWRAGVASLGAAGVVLMGIVLMYLWTRDPFAGVRIYAHHPDAYNGHLLTWPFHSLLVMPFDRDVLPNLKFAKVAYVWGQLAVVLAACWILVARVVRERRHADPLDVLCIPWLLGNTAFVVCVGDKWGFLAFSRFILPALPPLFWAFRRVLPSRWWVWAIIAAPSLAIAVDSVRRMN